MWCPQAPSLFSDAEMLWSLLHKPSHNGQVLLCFKPSQTHSHLWALGNLTSINKNSNNQLGVTWASVWFSLGSMRLWFLVSSRWCRSSHPRCGNGLSSGGSSTWWVFPWGLELVTLFLGPQLVCSAAKWFSARGRYLSTCGKWVHLTWTIQWLITSGFSFLQTGVLDDNRWRRKCI